MVHKEKEEFETNPISSTGLTISRSKGEEVFETLRFTFLTDVVVRWRRRFSSILHVIY